MRTDSATPPSAAAVVASEAFVKKHGLQSQAVEILGMAMATDLPSSFDEKSCIKMVGYDMTRSAARKVYEQSGFGPEDVDVVELHDCFSCNELITYEGLGLCPEGKGGEFVEPPELNPSDPVDCVDENAIDHPCFDPVVANPETNEDPPE